MSGEDVTATERDFDPPLDPCAYPFERLRRPPTVESSRTQLSRNVREHLRMALAEAGYPDAALDFDAPHVPWFCDDVPTEVWDRACGVVNR